MSTNNKGGQLSFMAAWAIGVGGMVGGGIFSTLGVVLPMPDSGLR